jgi:hypothetical protein
MPSTGDGDENDWSIGLLMLPFDRPGMLAPFVTRRWVANMLARSENWIKDYSCRSV